ncbi:Ribosomal protein L34e superfamily protein [Hordeum vulgare]|nr:Ribosomal protein L34e superfamily protein [Hordeum vulgare]
MAFIHPSISPSPSIHPSLSLAHRNPSPLPDPNTPPTSLSPRHRLPPQLLQPLPSTNSPTTAGCQTHHYLLHQLLSTVPLAGAAADWAALGWGQLGHHARNCGYRGLKKAVEFDIQLETAECVGSRPTPAARLALLAAVGAPRSVDLDNAHRELEAELRKMAPQTKARPPVPQSPHLRSCPPPLQP